jgi:chromosome segregation and condensation protein ScpB
MDKTKAKAIMEAILFAMGESVEISRLAEVIEEDAKTTKKILQEMQQEYSGRVENLERRIMYLEKLIASHEEAIRSKNEIISMLKKRLGEEG